ncbi:hypothetical protein [Rodentibacter pneumotropicus]|uniref:hypothetical protein n=1 Tax=Rodentibacter pneumotropicus TaxID=758 RepID=UPI00109D58AE|nr:hypothetical protein [Rodentibacter pneumotropicus]TGZ98079.1 hypothetical protein D3M79_10730 [Rodentibacter pneumotropicus]
MINIIKLNKLTLSKIKNNKYSMSPLNYREIGIKSTKQSKICSLLSDSDSKFVRGYETGSNCYVKNSNLAFIRPSNINRESPIVDKDSLIYLKPSVKDKDSKA